MSSTSSTSVFRIDTFNVKDTKFWKGLKEVIMGLVWVVAVLIVAPIAFTVFLVVDIYNVCGAKLPRWLARLRYGHAGESESDSESGSSDSRNVGMMGTASDDSSSDDDGGQTKTEKRNKRYMFWFSLAAVLLPYLAWMNILLYVVYFEEVSISSVEVFAPVALVVVVVCVYNLSLSSRLSDTGAVYDMANNERYLRDINFYLRDGFAYKNDLRDSRQVAAETNMIDNRLLLRKIKRDSRLIKARWSRAIVGLAAATAALGLALTGPLHRVINPGDRSLEHPEFFGRGATYDKLIVVSSAYSIFVFALAFLLAAVAIAAHYWKIYRGLLVAFNLVRDDNGGIKVVDADDSSSSSGEGLELKLNTSGSILMWLRMKREIRQWDRDSLVSALVHPIFVFSVIFLVAFAVVFGLRVLVSEVQSDHPFDELAVYGIISAVLIVVFLAFTVTASFSIAELPEKENQFLEEFRIADLQQYLDNIKAQLASMKMHAHNHGHGGSGSDDSDGQRWWVSSSSSSSSNRGGHKASRMVPPIRQLSPYKLDLAAKHLQRVMRTLEKAIKFNTPRPIKIFGLPLNRKLLASLSTSPLITVVLWIANRTQ